MKNKAFLWPEKWHVQGNEEQKQSEISVEKKAFFLMKIFWFERYMIAC